MSGHAARPKWYPISALLAGMPGPTWGLELAVWLRDIVARPLPALGRAGALCPFVLRALELSSLFTCDGRAGDGWAGDAADLVRAAESARDNFLIQYPLAGEADNLKAVMIAFPELPPANWPALKSARATVKPGIIAQGLTCSEFYPDNDDRSVHNTEIPIARSPVPCIIIRRLQSHDRIFLRSQPDLYPIFLRRAKKGDSDG